MFGCDDQVGVGDLMQSASDGHPVEGADDRLPDVVVQPRTRNLVADAALCRGSNVLARGKRAVPRTRDDGHSNVGVVADARPRMAELGAGQIVGSVEPLRAVDGDRGDMLADLEQDSLQFHDIPWYRFVAAKHYSRICHIVSPEAVMASTGLRRPNSAVLSGVWPPASIGMRPPRHRPLVHPTFRLRGSGAFAPARPRSCAPPARAWPWCRLQPC